MRFAGYRGGRQKDSADAIALDAQGYIDVVGRTDSPDFPSTPQAVKEHPGVNNNDWVGFATKPSSDASRVVYSTLIGGSYRTVATAVAVDVAGHAFVAGTTCSADFPVTPQAFQARAPGGGTARTYMNEGVKGLATNDQGNLYVAAYVNSPSLTGTPCALSTRPAGNPEVLLLKSAFR